MINGTLYKRGMKESVKTIVIFGAVITLYVSIIISMYDPEKMATLDSFYDVMPELMAAVGMKAGATSLMGFMISYLYGFILLIFPMVYSILRGNGLVARDVERGSMVALVAAPVKRSTVAFTQSAVLLSGVFLLLVYSTGLELAVAHSGFPGELEVTQLLALNAALLCLHLFIAGICFLASCVFSDTKYSVSFGAGIPALMYVLTMLSNAGEKAEAARYFSVFTLFDPEGIVAGESLAAAGAGILLVGALILHMAGILIFSRKDLHI